MIKNEKFSNKYTAIYINFPFCKYPCTYCHYLENLKFGYNFIPDEYFTMVIKQLQSILGSLKNKCISSIYFGGGTPSLLTDSQIEIIEKLFKNYGIVANEVSIEIHPGMCNFDYISNSFFTRYSIGVQTICQFIAKKYHRFSYDKEVIISMINNVRNSSFPKVINLDFVFDENISNDEILFVNDIQPETVTFYPNTQGKGVKRLENILMSLKKIKDLLQGYNSLAKSKYIFIKEGYKGSNYSKVEYEHYGDIIGIGHNSMSYINDNSYSCSYENDKIVIKKRCNKGDRLLSSLLMGIITGVTKKSVLKIIPDIYDKHFLQTVSDEIDVFDKHIDVKDNDLIFLPENEYLRFYEYIKNEYGNIYAEIFLSAIGYGDSDFETINKVYNSEFMICENNSLKFLKKLKVPKLRILVEGIDGSGKDTFVRFFVNELKRRFLFAKDSRISVMGQPDSTCKYGDKAKKFIEDLVVTCNKESVENILCNNRFESEKQIDLLDGIVILIRGFITDMATFEHKFGKRVYLGEGSTIKKWDMLIVVDADVEKANSQIKSRGLPRTWREYPKYLKYFREYYLKYESSSLYDKKIIIRNDGSIEDLNKKAIRMVDEIYERYKNR